MHWIDVDGYRLPRLLAGHPGLELCNTWAGWGEPPAPHREWLRDYDHLVAWAVHAGLIEAAAAPERGTGPDGVLDEVRALRTALHDVLLDPADTAAFAVVARHAERAAATARFVPDPPRWELTPGPDLPLRACARAAAELLASPARGQVRACPGDDCGWLFLDPRGRRRWCAMAVCGNRAKVRAYAARR